MTLSFLTAILLAGGVCADGTPEISDCATSDGTVACFRESDCPYRAAFYCEPAAQDRYVLSFGASWCGPCRQAAPMVKKLAARGLVVRHVDIDHDRKLAARYQVESIPTFVAVVDGREVDRMVGVPTEDRLMRLAAPVRAPLGMHMPPPIAPGAKDVQMLVRATYELPPARAKALTSFLKDMASAEVETRVEGRNLTVTTTPAAQRAIGQFIAVLMSGDESMQAVSTGECGGAACRLQKVAAESCDKARRANTAAKKAKFTKTTGKGTVDETRLKYWPVEPTAVFEGNVIRITVPGEHSKEGQGSKDAADDSACPTAQPCDGRLQITVSEPANRRGLILAANRYFIEQLKRKACELQQKIQSLEAEAEGDIESELPE